MPKSKKRKNVPMKETAAHRKAKLHLKRRDPSFRKHENKSREEVTFAVDYMTKTMNGEDRTELLEANAVALERMGGLEGLHEFLFFLDGLKEDWEDRLDEEGLLTVSAMSPEGIDFALQNEEDQAEAIG